MMNSPGIGVVADVPAAPPANLTLIQRILNKKKMILKWAMVTCILIFVTWLGSSFLESLAKTRKPMFLSTFSTAGVP